MIYLALPVLSSPHPSQTNFTPLSTSKLAVLDPLPSFFNPAPRSSFDFDESRLHSTSPSPLALPAPSHFFIMLFHIDVLLCEYVATGGREAVPSREGPLGQARIQSGGGLFSKGGAQMVPQFRTSFVPLYLLYIQPGSTHWMIRADSEKADSESRYIFSAAVALSS
jgi:hypothetical protein